MALLATRFPYYKALSPSRPAAICAALDCRILEPWQLATTYFAALYYNILKPATIFVGQAPWPAADLLVGLHGAVASAFGCGDAALSGRQSCLPPPFLRRTATRRS